jgi:putative nucleotidyltransferase with HDIG domain
MSIDAKPEYIIGLFPEINDIKDKNLREGVIRIWQDIGREMAWDTFEEIPKNARPNWSRSLVRHIRAVTQMALAICEIAKEHTDCDYDRDLLIAACVLHDVSKPIEYEPVPDIPAAENGVRTARKSEIGSEIQHAVYAAHKVFAHGLPVKLANLLITHTPSSRVRGKTWEAASLFYADFSDTDAGLQLVGQKMYLQKLVFSE